jgi:RNA polymerase sigma factor (sigma-70 family)
MTDDAELLGSYVEDCSESAFAQLVERHIGLVYHAALRQVGGDSALAQDIVQEVFILLAQKAPALRRHPTLAGWLHVATHRKVSEARRAERRRALREQEAFMSQESRHGSATGEDWERVRPALDEAILKLKHRDRDALLLRFFEARTFQEIGSSLALSEAAAQKRVSRALEKLRRVLARRGFTSSASALAAILAGQTGLAAPAGLAGSVAGTAMTSGAASLGPFASAKLAVVRTFMATTKSNLIVAAAVAASGALIMYQTHRRLALQRELEGLGAENQLLLSHAKRDAAAGKDAASALAGTRTKVAELLNQLQRRSTPDALTAQVSSHPLLPGMKHIGQANNAGQATLSAAAETLFWAMRNRQVDTLGRMIILNPETQSAATNLFASLPEDLRQRIQTPENMMTLWLSESFPENIAGYQLLEAAPAADSDRADVPTLIQFEDGKTAVSGFNLQKNGGDWMLVLNPGYVQALANNLNTLSAP